MKRETETERQSQRDRMTEREEAVLPGEFYRDKLKREQARERNTEQAGE